MEVTLRLATHPGRPGFYQTHVMDQSGNVWINTLAGDSLAFETVVDAIERVQQGAEQINLQENQP